jgi:hypothetical protein
MIHNLKIVDQKVFQNLIIKRNFLINAQDIKRDSKMKRDFIFMGKKCIEKKRSPSE